MSKECIATEDGHRFHSTGSAEHKPGLFSVAPNVPIVDALNSVSCLLNTLEDGILDAAMGHFPLQDNAAWLSHHTLQSAKAVVDSLIGSIESPLVAPIGRSAWIREGGYVAYFILDDVHVQRAPFGRFGPFPSANAMRKALDSIEAKFPDLILVSRKARLAAELIGESELNEEHAKTLIKIAALAV